MRHALVLSVAVAVAAAIPAQEAAAQSKPPAAKPAAPAGQQDPTAAEFDKFREVLEEDNPAELFEVRGKELWATKRGPLNASLEKCDLGLGPGVVKGAYVRMPRYFADVGKVMDTERRIVHCMVALQGFRMEDLAKQPFSTETRGREVFNYRAGPYDFSCATCHGDDGKRIRTQPLPNLTRPAEAIRAFQGWPGYRMTGGVMHTLQWRMNDCFRQQRFPAPDYVSDTITALLTYMGVNANGQVYKGPGIKR